MRQYKFLFLASLSIFICAGNAAAIPHTYTYQDTWVNWPGYTSTLGDEHGTPQLDYMEVSLQSFIVVRAIPALTTNSVILSFSLF